MAAVWARARAELRSGWRRGIGLALLLGLIAGAALAAAAGARRTDSALERFNRHQRAADVLLLDDGQVKFHPNLDVLATLPYVAASARFRYTYVISNEGLVAPTDDRLGRVVARPKVLQGRLQRPDRPEEVTVTFDGAKRNHLRVSSTFPLINPNYPAAADFVAAHPEAQLQLRVVGIVATPGELPPFQPGTVSVHGTPALYRFLAANEGIAAIAGHRDVEASPDSLLLRFKGGPADLSSFRRVFADMAGQRPHQLQSPQILDGGARRSIHLQAQALWLLAGLLTLSAALVFGQTLSRFTAVEAADFPRMKALGMTSSQLWGVAMLRVVGIGVVAAVVAVATALALSPLTPIRLARTIEPHPGLYVDWRALVAGAVVVVMSVALLALFPAWRTARATQMGGQPQARSSVVAGALARAGMPPAIVAGTRMALESGRGRTAVPVRSTVLGAALAVAALVAALTFGTSLAHLIDTPRLYGVVWDMRLTNYSDAGTDADGNPRDADLAHYADEAARVPGVAAVGTATLPGAIDVGGRDTGLMDVERALRPPVLTGRYPAGPDDAALGAKTMRRLHAHIDSTITLKGFAGNPLQYRVVGKTILPADGDPRLGEGVLMARPGLHRALEGAELAGASPGADSLFIRFAPGANADAVVADLQRVIGSRASAGGILDVLPPTKPTDVVNFGGVQALPFVLAGILAVLGVATMIHLIASAVRRRRRDLAILKTLGFSRGQVTAAVLWQGAILAALALLIGVPLGVGVGRWLWTFFATQQGVVVEPRIPVPAVLLVVPAAIVVAGLVAAVPARVASLIKPALVLRTE